MMAEDSAFWWPVKPSFRSRLFRTCHEIEVLRCMRLVCRNFRRFAAARPHWHSVFVRWHGDASILIRNEPQYQYPGKNDFRRCPLVSRPIRAGVKNSLDTVTFRNTPRSQVLHWGGDGSEYGTLIRRYGSCP